MGTPWLALVIPAFAVLCLLCFMVMPGMVYSAEQKVDYTGVAKKIFDLYGEHYRTALLLALPCLPIIVLECLFGCYQRSTESRASKVVCNTIAVIGVVLIFGIYKHLGYEN